MKSKLYSRTSVVLLSLMLLIGLMPGMSMTAFAADNGKAIQLVDNGAAANISGGQTDNICFGTYQQSSDGSGGYNTDPIKWRVLSNADGKLFLLADQNLDVQAYNGSDTSITWEKSTIRSWLNGYGASENSDGMDYSTDNFIDAAFSGGEQGAISDTYVYNKTQSDGISDPNPSHPTSGGSNTTDKIFALSIEEANNSGYFPNGDSSRMSTNTDYVASRNTSMSGSGAEDYWWLRSPGTNDNTAADVQDSGALNYGHRVDSYFIAVRPAFHLNLNSVLFTSAAKDGKASGIVGAGALQSVSDDSGSEWKLTLKDDSRSSFTASANSDTTKDEGYSDWTVDVSYESARTGDNEYVSVLLCDSSGDVLYYGNIAQNSASGTVTLNIPSTLAAGSYTLKVFSEQRNGDYKTDYASDFKNISLTVTPDTAPSGESGNPGSQTPTDIDTPTGDSRTGDANTPQTGDDSNITLWIAMLLASGVALTGTILYNRKKKYGR